MADEQITNIAELVAAVTACSNVFGTTIWWRGHTKLSWQLRPRVFRDEYDGIAYEKNAVARFIQKAPTRYPNCPAMDRASEWLYLMQHYGVPTRLLDWSESALVAAFFAVRDPNFDTEDAAIWAVAAALLNKEQCDQKGFVSPTSEAARKVFSDAFHGGDEEPTRPIIALHSQEIDLRMMVQHSASTIHGSREAIEDLPNKEKFLTRFVIPAAAKPQFRGMLKALGFSTTTLFPDLEHLAKDIRSLKFQL